MPRPFTACRTNPLETLPGFPTSFYGMYLSTGDSIDMETYPMPVPSFPTSAHSQPLTLGGGSGGPEPLIGLFSRPL